MRHAIYFTPNPASELHRLGSSWLGRDSLTGASLRQPDDRLSQVTASPRRYGLHATLKPPFRLKDNVSAEAVELTLRTIATQHKGFAAPALQIEDIDGFLALTPIQPCRALHDLADDCVQRLDNFRVPHGEEELRRRRLAGLSPRQDELLIQWGYPYVLEEFQFHITLTERLSDEDRAWVLALTEAHFEQILGKPFVVDAITVMIEPEDGDDFRLLERFPLVHDAQEAA
jgi:putative phosphonate metabolism protein